jgi:dolichyl-phosphate-mannose-protein mannosyltransferase
MRRTFWLDFVVLPSIFVLGASRLPAPFGGDQALNLLLGQMISRGGSPYRDLWDLKHPGVFFFFAAGGALFGFNEIGIHLFELFWMVALALLVRVVAGGWLEDRASASLAPALTVGLYYAAAGPFHLTEAEALVGLPLLLCLWCTVEALKAKRRMSVWLVASGFAAGVVTVFKIPYVALAMVFWLLAVRELRSRRVGLRRAVVSIAPWVIVGALLPVLATVTFLLQKGVAALAFWTYFKHPAEVAAAIPMEPRRLLYAFRFWIVTFAPALALAGIGVRDALRRRMDVMTAGVCAWLSVGLLLIVMQVISWWEYHFLLLVVPVGLLAARGLEAARKVLSSWLTPGQQRRGHAVGALALVLLFAPQLRSATRITADTWRSRPLPFSDEGIAAYHAEHYSDYASIRTRTAFLREPGSQPGPIYVIDTPIYYVYARRTPAIPLLAPWFHPTDRLWKRFHAQLEEARPPYVRVSASALQAIVADRPSLRDEVATIVPLIESRYETLSRDADGTWYIRRDLASRR